MGLKEQFQRAGTQPVKQQETAEPGQVEAMLRDITTPVRVPPKPEKKEAPMPVAPTRPSVGATVQTEKKIRITIWLDRETVEYFRGTGPGWQGRMNEALRKMVDRR